MSETPDMSEAPVGEDAFEAARLAEQTDDQGGELQEAAPEAEEGAEPEAKAVDWEKRAHDKEGLAAKERARRRAAESTNRELLARVERLEKKPAAQDGDDIVSMIAALPSGDDDPIGKMEAIEKIIRKFGEQQQGDTEAETKEQATRQELERLGATVKESEAEFSEEHPDYADALTHLAKAMLADLEDEGYAGAGLERAFQQRRLELAKRFVSNGRDPAEGIYNLAKKRGFKAGEAATNDKLKEIAAAAGATRIPAGGKHGDTTLTADAVNKLKGAAYDSAWEKLRQQQRRAG